MKKFVSLILALIFCLSLAACGSSDDGTDNGGKETKAEADNANVLSADIYELAKALPEKLDLDDMDILTDKDENAENNLIYLFGVDEPLLNNIDSYIITQTHRSTDARTIVVIKFKDGTDKELINTVKNAVNDVYLKNLITTTATYDPEQSKLASGGSFREYDNALAFAVYDNDGNDVVFDVIEGK